MSVTVIQEQKGTNFAVVSVLRNLMFAMNCCLAAANMVCELWGLDRNEVVRFVAEKNEVEAISWDQMIGLHQAVQEGVDLASANIVVDSTEDPQPAR